MSFKTHHLLYCWWRGRGYMCGGREIFVPSAPCCCEPKITLKIVSIKIMSLPSLHVPIFSQKLVEHGFLLITLINESNSIQWSLYLKVKVLIAQSCLTLCEPTRLLCPWDYPSKNTGMGSYFCCQGIFPT